MYKIKNIKIIIQKLQKKHFMKKVKKNFLHYYSNSKDPEIINMIKVINKNKRISMINNDLSQDYNRIKVNVLFDIENNFHYIIDNGKRLYFKKNMSVEEIDNLYRALKLEQDKYSPHRYMSEDDFDDIINYGKKNDNRNIRVYELGAMEGMFSLSLVDFVDQLDIFECDSSWVEALRHTFAPYQHKVNIINKYVSNLTSETSICLDDYVSNDSLDSYNLVKMDIEGYEINALKGMKNFMEKSYQLFMFVCCYHRYDDEINIKKICSDYKIYHNPGYFLFFESDDYAPPYVRRCLLKVKK